jgi:hypothetical protein
MAYSPGPEQKLPHGCVNRQLAPQGGYGSDWGARASRPIANRLKRAFRVAPSAMDVLVRFAVRPTELFAKGRLASMARIASLEES